MADTNYRSSFPRALYAGNTQAENASASNRNIAQARDYNIHDEEIKKIQATIGACPTGCNPATIINRLDGFTIVNVSADAFINDNPNTPCGAVWVLPVSPTLTDLIKEAFYGTGVLNYELLCNLPVNFSDLDRIDMDPTGVIQFGDGVIIDGNAVGQDTAPYPTGYFNHLDGGTGLGVASIHMNFATGVIRWCDNGPKIDATGVGTVLVPFPEGHFDILDGGAGQGIQSLHMDPEGVILMGGVDAPQIVPTGILGTGVTDGIHGIDFRVAGAEIGDGLKTVFTMNSHRIINRNMWNNTNESVPLTIQLDASGTIAFEQIRGVSEVIVIPFSSGSQDLLNILDPFGEAKFGDTIKLWGPGSADTIVVKDRGTTGAFALGGATDVSLADRFDNIILQYTVDDSEFVTWVQIGGSVGK